MEPMMSESEEAQRSLHALFSRRSIAVTGASLSEVKLGHVVLSILTSNYRPFSENRDKPLSPVNAGHYLVI
jgi:hypothetical protein